jgi:hypothetical protein
MKRTAGWVLAAGLTAVALAACEKKSAEPSETKMPPVAKVEADVPPATPEPPPEAIAMTPPPEIPPAADAMPDEEEPSAPDGEAPAPTPGQRLDRALHKAEEGVRKATEKTGEALQRAGEAIERKAQGE